MVNAAPGAWSIRLGFHKERHIRLGHDACVLHPLCEVAGSGVGFGLINILPVGENGDLVRRPDFGRVSRGALLQFIRG